MATNKYKVVIKQALEIEIDNENKKISDRVFIKKEVKHNPPHIETMGCYYSIKSSNKVSIVSIKKIAEYKECPKCLGSGKISENEDYYCLNNSSNDCPRCQGRGEIIKRRLK